MRLAILDTNVIVSAGIKPGGIPAKIVMDWVMEGQVQLVTSPAVVAEYREVVGVKNSSDTASLLSGWSLRLRRVYG